MRISTNIQFADAKEERRQGERGFTMVEIAIAIGVIGFALVAVIGILPRGMNVQKDNREDTMISEDAPIFLDAIRTGTTNTLGNAPASTGLDYLTNYVEKIMDVGVTNGGITVFPPGGLSGFGSGWEIIGLLSRPGNLGSTGGSNFFTRAIVRALSGSAVQQNGANIATAFRYQMDVQVVPYVSYAPDATNYLQYNSDTNSPEYITRYYRYMELSGNAPSPAPEITPWGLGSLGYNLYDVRIHFSWPVIYAGTNVIVGPGRQNYRTMIASGLVQSPNPVTISGYTAHPWFFQPQSYATNNQGNL